MDWNGLEWNGLELTGMDWNGTGLECNWSKMGQNEGKWGKRTEYENGAKWGDPKPLTFRFRFSDLSPIFIGTNYLMAEMNYPLFPLYTEKGKVYSALKGPVRRPSPFPYIGERDGNSSQP